MMPGARIAIKFNANDLDYSIITIGATGYYLVDLNTPIYGIYICRQANNNPGRYGYVRNWQFTLQRWTAWFLVIFLIWHVFYLRIFTKAINGTTISYELLQTLFTSSPITTLLYTIGMFAAIFHFCNGITTFCMTWGIAKGPRIQNVINVLSMCLCAFLCLVTIAFMASYFVM